MMYAFVFALLFIVSICIQVVIMPTLPLPLAFIPIHLMLGTVIMHRADSIYGILWFMGAAIFIPFFNPVAGTAVAYLTAAAVGWFLERRLFASRSLYALLGLGSSIYVCFAGVRTMFDIITEGGARIPISLSMYGLLFMALGLYICFLFARITDRLNASVIISPRI